MRVPAALRPLQLLVVVLGLGPGPAGAQAAIWDLQLPDLEGKIHRLSEYEGRWVVLNFWATWCPPCLEEIPELLLFQERFRDQGVVVVGVNAEDIGADRLRRFVEDHFIDYPVWRMDPHLRTPVGRIMALPTTLVVSPQGELVKVHMGAVTQRQLIQYLGRPDES